MSQQMFEIGADKLERLHAEAAEQRRARLARFTPWSNLLRWFDERFDPI